MCGIAGIWTRKRGIDESILRRIQEVLRHRGPDDCGVGLGLDGRVALMNTRLSIIDLSPAGHQPMWSKDKTLCLTFNGEIYNFISLREELEKQGHHFNSSTDTEVVLKGYQEWGIDVVDRLVGMFAFAIWNETEKCLWLVRDRLGEKPLYYWYNSNRQELVFGSEIKALLVWPRIKRAVNQEALHCYLALGYTPAPHTMFEGIHKLPAAHRLRFDGGNLKIERYWNVGDLASIRVSQEEHRWNVRRLITEAVEKRLISDVPLGAFLSGGLDSSIIVGLMRRHIEAPVKTFCTAFEVGPRSFKYNVDSEAARKVSHHFGTDHTEITIRVEPGTFLETLQKMVTHLDEPQAAPATAASFLAAEQVTQNGVKVILTGDGSDECFGGYGRYVADQKIDLLRRIPSPLRSAIQKTLDQCGSSSRLKRALEKATTPPASVSRYLGWWEQFNSTERNQILAPEWLGGIEGLETVIRDVYKQCHGGNGQDQMCYADLMLWVANDSNLRVDKTTMAHSVESRAPFLDHRLVEYAMGIPFNKKTRWGRRKHLLKSSFSDLLPPFVLKRPKWGWFAPVHYWVKDSLWDFINESVAALPRTGVFREEVTDLLQEYPPRQPQKLWTLMIWAIWYDTFIESLELPSLEK